MSTILNIGFRTIDPSNVVSILKNMLFCGAASEQHTASEIRFRSTLTIVLSDIHLSGCAFFTSEDVTIDNFHCMSLVGPESLELRLSYGVKRRISWGKNSPSYI